jgi:hypothetical protein
MGVKSVVDAEIDEPMSPAVERHEQHGRPRLARSRPRRSRGHPGKRAGGGSASGAGGVRLQAAVSIAEATPGAASTLPMATHPGACSALVVTTRQPLKQESVALWADGSESCR